MIQLLLISIFCLDIIVLLGMVAWVRRFKIRERAEWNKAREALLGLPQGVVLVGKEGHILAMNIRAKRMFPQEHLQEGSLGEDLEFFDAAGGSIPSASHPLRHAWKTRRSTTATKFWIRTTSDRLVPVSVVAGYLPSVNGIPIVVGLIRDLSREEMMETMKHDFIEIASHQLRSPLASLKWYGEILSRDVHDTLEAKDREYLDCLNEATDRMISLVDDFLDASRFESSSQPTHVTKVALKELFAHIIDVQRPVIETKGLSVRIIAHKTMKDVYADPAMLREVLANFVANAVKYNRKGGKVNIRVRVLEGDVEVQVQDTGVGIPKDQQDRLFTKFFRADNAVEQGYKGTGLGLYTAKLFLDQMGGSVRFESKASHGTTFWVRFPRDQRQHSTINHG